MAESETGLSRRDREREQHRIDILDAAELVFVRDGFAAKIETIAKAAEYSVGSLYNFFPSKEELFKNVLLRISQLRIEGVDKALPGLLADPWAGLRTICHLWLAHHLRHGDFLHIAHSMRFRCAGALFSPDDPVERQLRANFEAYRERLTRYFAALVATPEARPIDPSILFTTFEGYIRSSLFVFSRMHNGDGKGDVSALEAEVHKALCILFRK